MARLFAPHLLALLFPLNALAFAATGPHRGWVAALFLVPVFGSVFLDRQSGPETRQPAANIPAWPFDALLLALTAIQIANVALLARMAAHTPLLSFDILAAMVAVGSSSGYSGIVVAHELIHRPRGVLPQLGRLILATVVYEHFYTEHLRGHHQRVGTDEDPATARFGESFNHFYIRTVPAQFKSAWRLSRRRVLEGIAVEGAIVVGVGLVAGPVGVLMHLMQAWWATRALEVVNYFEHWGLRRQGRRVAPVDSWDTSSRFTYYALTGLSRHADHHAFASRPYQQLRAWAESPKLPRGYLAMFPMVLGRNPRFQSLMTEELRRRGLGPFAPAAQGEVGMAS